MRAEAQSLIPEQDASVLMECIEGYPQLLWQTLLPLVSSADCPFAERLRLTRLLRALMTDEGSALLKWEKGVGGRDGCWLVRRECVDRMLGAGREEPARRTARAEVRAA